MKKVILVLAAIYLSYSSAAQELPKRMANFHIGRTMHGSGDIMGVSLGFTYNHYFTKRISGFTDFGFSIHDGSEPIFYENREGRLVNGSILYTTAGIQQNIGVMYSFVRTRRHELQTRLSGVFRYQSTSLFDSAETLYPPITGLPFPVTVFVNELPPRTFAVGAALGLGYNYSFGEKYSLGLLANFQIDSNGDTIAGYFLTSGYRFR
ncbi:MAG: hypothetical protein HC913_09605 [Microscillaceae bacterium]|nr:hypothetical protein [Microscillaceae bacterium]